ncbi:hypothetical protein [Tersicoccus sp. Bi-70]|uniref:hypothetical protein n=1 Tax=Tersicoccus sp. Bi-70 TaxID=1897634 RepID=UPI0009766CF0|nr:hypothetical protein [Tersicoccus sp. Bi-70]OMH35094.1 hypothetical protein BGP79_01865 [Tersicoccus sp. Bi-70]
MMRGNQGRRAVPSSVAASVLLVGALTLTGCTSASDNAPPTRTQRTADAVATAGTGRSTDAAAGGTNDGDDFGYPLIAPTPAGEKILVSASMRTGVAQLTMTPPTEGALVTVQIACRGEGAITVSTWNISYRKVTCRPTGDDFENETLRMAPYATGGAAPTLDARSFGVGVTADKRQQWAITISERPASAPASPSQRTASPTTTAPARR